MKILNYLFLAQIFFPPFSTPSDYLLNNEIANLNTE